MILQPEISLRLSLTEVQAKTDKKIKINDIGQDLLALILLRMIKEGSNNIEVRQFTQNYLKDKGINPYPFSVSVVSAIYEFMNKEVNYMNDVKGIETLYTAEKVLKNRYGDCDDKVILAGAMLYSLGYQLAIVYLDILNEPTYYQHVYLWVWINGKPIAFDSCISAGALGKEVKRFYRRKVWIIK